MKKNFNRYARYYAAILALGFAAATSACGSSTEIGNDKSEVAESTEKADQDIVETDDVEQADDTSGNADDTSGNADDTSDKEDADKADDTDDTSDEKDGKKSDKTDSSSDEDSDASENDDASDSSEKEVETSSVTSSGYISKDDISVNETIEDSSDGGHAIQADGQSAEYSNIEVVKTGDSSGDEADFYGENAAIFATNGGTLDLSEIIVETDGAHANGVFSYGEGTTVNISDSVIETSGNCSGGLMTTGGGTMNATNLTIHTTGNSSAAIRSDRGGGTVTVTGGSYTTEGTGSPAIYSTADITVNDASLTSTASQGVVVEGQNSVTLNDVTLVADNNKKNSDKSAYYQAVMIYQSMSGDADEGTAAFSMDGGSITNKNGDIFFVNNTVATISLTDVDITNEDSEGIFLRAEAAGWGTEGSNGGNVTLNASDQEINGDIVVDDVSSLNLYLADASTFEGAINSDGQAGQVYVELSDGSTWTLTADSYISSLTCETDSINLNGYTLYVDGAAYTEGSESSGTVIESASTSSGEGSQHSDNGHGDGKPSGKPGE
ncbi:MAG: hypothetical protein K6E10_05760 [Eubacterium sp.]|nr:hypothetical protein [Eubacterium sp.]